MKILALTGPKGSGKDTIGRIIKELLLNECHTIAFADPIKQQILNIFKLNSIQDYDLLKRSNVEFFDRFVEGRHVVREIGMLMRSYNENQFNDYVLSNILKNQNAVWIVTDLRFKNELDFLKYHNAKIVRVTNYRAVEKDSHVTELGFSSDDYDYIIPNHGDLDVLKINIKTFLQTIKEQNENWFDIQFKERV